MIDLQRVQETCKHFIEDALGSKNQLREGKWTNSITVGRKRFVEATKELFGIKVTGGECWGEDRSYEVREPGRPLTVLLLALKMAF